MLDVSREASLNGAKFPVHVRQEQHTTATSRIRHDVMKLMFVNGANTTLRHEFGSLLVHEGEAVLLPAGRWYSGHPSGTVLTTTAYIDNDFFREHTRWLDVDASLRAAVSEHGAGPLTIELAPSSRCRGSTILQLMLESQRASISVAQRLPSAVDLLTILSAHRHGQRGDHPALQRAVTTIEAHLNAPWSVESLASTCAISASQLSRLFQRHLGTSPARYLREQRANRMAELLITTDDRIDLIARRVGWQGPTHASRVFRNLHGVSPQQYRRSLANESTFMGSDPAFLPDR